MSTQLTYPPPSFAGFEHPRENYYRLPNGWFDLWTSVRARLEGLGVGTNRIDALLKWSEYLLKHSWGYLNFDAPVRLTNDEFERGRRRATRNGTRGSRMDLGTGLSSRTLTRLPSVLVDLGLIECREDRSDKARVKKWYLPRLRPTDGDWSPVSSQTTLETFNGFDYPDSNYFPVPFEWTNLTCEIHSAVEILATEYLMRHTFGWRDPIRWMTPTEIATGRQKADGTTYDSGISYSRNAVAAACEALVRRGLLVWRRAQREIGREGREYTLCLKGMCVDEDSGLLLGTVSDDPDQSKPLTDQSKGDVLQEGVALEGQSEPSNGQSKPLIGQSKPLVGQSKPLIDQSKPLISQSKPLAGRSKPRSDNNTLGQHSSPNQDQHLPTTSATLCDEPAAADDVALRLALKDVGVTGRKRDEILALSDPPQPEEVYGWAYWAYGQDWADRNPIGAAIQMLLNPDSRHDPPSPFNLFGWEHGGPASAARALAEAYRLSGYDVAEQSQLFEGLQREWRDSFGRCYPNDLPLPNPAGRLWPQEFEILRADIERPPSREDVGQWADLWEEFLSLQAPMAREMWCDTSEPVGYAQGRLVICFQDITARVVAEEHRARWEDVLGKRLQLTAAEIDLPEGTNVQG